MKNIALILLVAPVILLGCNKEQSKDRIILGDWKLVEKESEIGLESGNPDASDDQIIYSFTDNEIESTGFKSVNVDGMACAYRLTEDATSFDMVEDPTYMDIYTNYIIDDLTSRKMELTVDGQKIKLKKK